MEIQEIYAKNIFFSNQALIISRNTFIKENSTTLKGFYIRDIMFGKTNTLLFIETSNTTIYNLTMINCSFGICLII